MSLNKGENMQEIKDKLKDLIVAGLNLEDIKSSDINDDEPLFGEGLGLDSVDALEIALMVQKEFGISLDSKNTNLKEVFYSVSSLAKFIKENVK